MTQPREAWVKVTSKNSWRIKAKNAKPKLGAGCTATVGMAVFLGAKAQPRETFSDDISSEKEIKSETVRRSL